MKQKSKMYGGGIHNTHVFKMTCCSLTDFSVNKSIPSSYYVLLPCGYIHKLNNDSWEILIKSALLLLLLIIFVEFYQHSAIIAMENFMTHYWEVWNWPMVFVKNQLIIWVYKLEIFKNLFIYLIVPFISLFVFNINIISKPFSLLLAVHSAYKSVGSLHTYYESLLGSLLRPTGLCVLWNQRIHESWCVKYLHTYFLVSE